MTVIAHVSTPLGVAGALVLSVLCGGYIWAAARPSPRGRRWPRSRTACFVAGLLLLSLATQSPLARYDELPWFHASQHLVVMMAVPPLLVLGSPVTLLLRTISPEARREVIAVLHDPALKRFGGPVAGAGLTLEYYGTMFIVMLTPVYGWTLQHEWLHVLVHGYLLLCGLLFWMPLVGRDNTGWRPEHRTKLIVVGLGVPANIALGLLVASGGPLQGAPAVSTTAAAWVLGAGGALLTVAGLALVASSRRAPGREHARTATA